MLLLERILAHTTLCKWICSLHSPEIKMVTQDVE
jgi:hypothetical protein